MGLDSNPFVLRDREQRKAKAAAPVMTPERSGAADALRGRTMTGQMRALTPNGDVDRSRQPAAKVGGLIAKFERDGASPAAASAKAAEGTAVKGPGIAAIAAAAKSHRPKTDTPHAAAVKQAADPYATQPGFTLAPEIAKAAAEKDEAPQAEGLKSAADPYAAQPGFTLTPEHEENIAGRYAAVDDVELEPEAPQVEETKQAADPYAPVAGFKLEAESAKKAADGYGDPGLQLVAEAAAHGVDPRAAAALHQPLRAPVSPEAKAEMREASDDVNEWDDDRLPLKARESEAEGWALLPMEKTSRRLDDGEHESFKTIYHHASRAEADRNKHGMAADLKRGDHLIELVDGKFVFDVSGSDIDTTAEKVPNQVLHNALAALNDKKQANKGRPATQEENEKKLRKLQAAGGRYIYVMTGDGQFYAGKNIPFIQHHSSFMAGAAVAGAGDVVVAGGELKLISNVSGHYKPGPAYLWQVLAQLDQAGVDLASVQVEVLGIKGKFSSAAEMLQAIDPSSDTSLFDPKKGIEACNRYLADKRGGA